MGDVRFSFINARAGPGPLPRCTATSPPSLRAPLESLNRKRADGGPSRSPSRAERSAEHLDGTLVLEVEIRSAGPLPHMAMLEDIWEQATVLTAQAFPDL